MTTLLTIWLAGMPFALAFLIRAFWEAPKEDMMEISTLSGMAALVVFVVFWPVFLFLAIKDAISER